MKCLVNIGGACFRAVWIGAVLVGLAAASEDWPTYHHDNRRSGVTAEQLALPLEEAWRYTAPHAPRPAWPAPAKADLWHHVSNINPMVTYDRAFHVVVAGDTLYFGSSADDKVYALDVSTGEERWSFFTGGPVRLAPTMWEGKVYIGADDGRVYCLEADDGDLIWEYAASRESRMIPGNERVMSVWPVRTGVLVDRGIAYFCAGLFPTEGVYLCALNAKDGSEVWNTTLAEVSPQGYLLASATSLYTPRGRIAPSVFSRKNGGLVGSFSGEGGTYALLTDDALVYGPTAAGELGMGDTTRQERIATFAGNHMVEREGITFLQTQDKLTAINWGRYIELEQQKKSLAAREKKASDRFAKLRKRGSDPKAVEAAKQELVAVKNELKVATKALAACREWKRVCDHRHELILAGDVLFAGGDDEVAAYNAGDGALRWEGKVDGRAYGLTVANGRLFVSTSQGAIHCFQSQAVQRPTSILPPQHGNPFSAGTSRCWVAYLAEKAGATKGYALVLGCGDGHVPYALAQQTELQIIALDPDPEEVAGARRALDAAGVYGSQVTVHLWRGAQERLPYTDYFANLVVCDLASTSGKPPVRAEEVYRVLRPEGGVAYVGWPEGGARADLERWVGASNQPKSSIVEERGLWAVLNRGPLPGAGAWTHMYGDPTNSACSYDARVRGPMRIQWFGRPGPRLMVDRHHQNVAPVYHAGRIYIPGDNRLIAVDAYNGVMLWHVEVPNSRRLGAPQDTCNLAAAHDGSIYLALEDTCRVFDGTTGDKLRELGTPQLIDGQHRYWGYTAVVGGRLFGSGRKPEAVYAEISWAADSYQWTDFKRMVTSDYLFCLDRHTGEIMWTYQGGVIINPAIAIGGGRLYFVESLNPEAAKDADGKMKLEVLFRNGANIVALDIKTGEAVWRHARDLSEFTQIIFASYAQETLLVSGSKNVGKWLWHVLRAFDARTGEPRWRQEQNTGWPIGGRHGEQSRHPAIVGDTIYAEPHAYDLHAGAPKEGWRLDRGGGGCGTLTASASALFFRGGNPQMYSIEEDLRTPLNRVSRPGCWVNIIPAGGLVLIPESSSGCTCAYPLQTSFAFAPQ